MDTFLFVLLLLLAAMIAIIALIYRYAWMKARIPLMVQREFNQWKGAAEFEMQQRIQSRVEEWQDREAQTILAEAQRDSLVEAHKLFKDWCEDELEAIRKEQRELALREARNRLTEWMQGHEKNIRQDAVQRSQAVTTGKIVEHLVPYLPNFNYNPKDARFIGSPVDFIVFDGLSDDEDEQLSIVFVEIKTGMATLTKRERMVRDAIKAGRVKWAEWHASNELQQAAPGMFE
ncbi:MAG: Holliday junction resolvase-like protein [Blastocatellia bacterium]